MNDQLIYLIFYVPVVILIMSIYFIKKFIDKRREEKAAKHILDNKWKIIERDLKEKEQNSERQYIRIK